MSRRTLLVATNNRGKVREYAEILHGLPLRLVTLAEQGIGWQAAETGLTFAENAVLKARAYAKASGLLTLADDSGLEVDALGGRPGVLSARYAGEGASDAERNHKLLEELATVPWPERSARFRCAIAVCEPGGVPDVVEGTVEGVVALEPRGSGGFGYDPIFYLPELGLTMAELPPEEKNRISHRARAGALARRLLAAKFVSPPPAKEACPDAD